MTRYGRISGHDSDVVGLDQSQEGVFEPYINRKNKPFTMSTVEVGNLLHQQNNKAHQFNGNLVKSGHLQVVEKKPLPKYSKEDLK
jgi:hypothetical protein